MKSKDQQLLEEAYNDIILDEMINWKGALTAAAMAAATLLGSAGNAKAEMPMPSQSIEQTSKNTAEDIIPRKDFEQVLDMLRQAITKGDYKSAKQIYNVIHKECTDAVTEVHGSAEIEKVAKMDAEALKIWNDAYLGVVKTGMGNMANSIKAAQ